MPDHSPESSTRTPWAVICPTCGRPGDHLVFLTREEYMRQLSSPDYKWECPRCGQNATWSDSNYELADEDEEWGGPRDPNMPLIDPEDNDKEPTDV
jgi:predicted RNA-binding Zn-ribbon protein involved in translation (DUF1610 family)